MLDSWIKEGTDLLLGSLDQNEMLLESVKSLNDDMELKRETLFVSNI